MPDKKTEILLAQLLSDLGFSVSRIRRSDEERRPDFIASKGQETYVIEEKSKEILRLFDEAKTHADKCGVGSASEGIEPSNTLSGIVRKTEGQLAHRGPQDAFRILWFSCLDNYAEHVFELMRRTLYGLANVSVWSDTTPVLLKPSVPCYYYYRNTFFRCAWLDGTVLWSGKLWGLCVNEFSEQADALRKSSLYRLFLERGGLVDPQELEKERRAFVIRSDMDRTDEKAKWRYLLQKYGCRTSVLSGSAFAGMMHVTHTDEKKK